MTHPAQLKLREKLSWTGGPLYICGADDWANVAAFGRAKEGWLREFLELPNGIPSPDTFGGVFSLLAPGAFEECFRAWAVSMRQVLPEEILAIDGKTLGGSRDRAAGAGPLHVVSAWAAASRVVLGQASTEAKSNEIEAIARLLDTLLLTGCIVTIDALGCQTAIAEKIVEREGDYALALKGNQRRLAAEVEEACVDADAKDYAGRPLDSWITVRRFRVLRCSRPSVGGMPLDGRLESGRGPRRAPLARH